MKAKCIISGPTDLGRGRLSDKSEGYRHKKTTNVDTVIIPSTLVLLQPISTVNSILICRTGVKGSEGVA
jgi:hypothetical protein